MGNPLRIQQAGVWYALLTAVAVPLRVVHAGRTGCGLGFRRVWRQGSHFFILQLPIGDD